MTNRIEFVFVVSKSLAKVFNSIANVYSSHTYFCLRFHCNFILFSLFFLRFINLFSIVFLFHWIAWEVLFGETATNVWIATVFVLQYNFSSSSFSSISFSAFLFCMPSIFLPFRFLSSHKIWKHWFTFSIGRHHVHLNDHSHRARTYLCIERHRSSASATATTA